MKLIYLDTSNLSLLTKTKSKFPKQFKSFIDKWRESNFVLVLSEAHLSEIIRHGSEIEINSRFELINEFLPIRFERILFLKEIVSALKRKKLFNFAVTDFEVHNLIFSKIIFSKKELSYLKKLSKGHYSNYVINSYEIAKNLWQPNRFVPAKRRDKKFRVGDLPTSFPSEFKEYLQKILKISKLYSQGNPVAWNQLNNFVSRAENIGFQKAFIELFAEETNDQYILKKSVDELQLKIVFKNSISFFLSQLLITDRKTVNQLAEQITIEECPGQWLRYEVEKQIRKSGDSNVSNEMDLKHISHLPYVDILITDKRIVENTNQILRKGNLPDMPKPISSPIKVSDNIKSLENVLFQ